MSKRPFKFFRYKNVWRYKEVGEVPVLVDTRALEQVLGVIGGPLVYVCRETGHPETPYLRIEIKNGFITRASVTDDIDTPLKEGVEVEEFCVRPLRN